MSVRVKICCVKSRQEAALAVKCGASAVGLVSEMPSGPGVIPEIDIARIVPTVPPGVATFLLTSRLTAKSIAEQVVRLGPTTVQIVDALPDGEWADLRTGLPGVSLVQVIHVRDASAIAEAVAVAPRVDALLLDSGNPDKVVKELGGTGRTHNWAISRDLCTAVSVPVYLAGGLNAGNVAEAIARVRPYGVDVCSGVRTDDRLDETKLAAFMQAVAGA